jgi:hypothetical protein
MTHTDHQENPSFLTQAGGWGGKTGHHSDQATGSLGRLQSRALALVPPRTHGGAILDQRGDSPQEEAGKENLRSLYVKKKKKKKKKSDKLAVLQPSKKR